jgi:hypothetical protein
VLRLLFSPGLGVNPGIAPHLECARLNPDETEQILIGQPQAVSAKPWVTKEPDRRTGRCAGRTNG